MYYAAKTSLGVQHNPIVRDLRWQLRLFCADYCAMPPGERHFVLRLPCFAFLGLRLHLLIELDEIQYGGS